MLQIYLLIRVMRMLVSIYLIYDSWFFFTFEAGRKLKKKSNDEKIA